MLNGRWRSVEERLDFTSGALAGSGVFAGTEQHVGQFADGARLRRVGPTAEAVFGACRDHRTAVEINSRPERRDPPTRLLRLAEQMGCVFAINTDAHAPGQLDYLGHGAQRALGAAVPADRVINAWPAERLLAWH